LNWSLSAFEAHQFIWSGHNKNILRSFRQEREEKERKRRLQLYLFVSGCVAYPFNAKQPTDQHLLYAQKMQN
jgi:hypothetical protein